MTTKVIENERTAMAQHITRQPDGPGKRRTDGNLGAWRRRGDSCGTDISAVRRPIGRTRAAGGRTNRS
jgi:hypothetical protein